MAFLRSTRAAGWLAIVGFAASCQLVFGLDKYEEASTSAATSSASSGGTGASGGGGGCAAGLFPVDSVCCDTPCDQPCYACNLSGKEGICSKLNDGTPDACMGGTCMNGVCTCSGPADCPNSLCYDGYCCDNDCSGSINCKTCGLAGSEGICTNVPQGNSDIDSGCDGATACDGNGACLGASGAPCGSDGDCASGVCVNMTMCQ